MNDKVLQMATEITIKAMGPEQSTRTWITEGDKVSEFLKKVAATVDGLYVGGTTQKR